MAHRIRWYAPGVRDYAIVTKCAGDEMLMRPDAFARFVVALALAGALGRHRGVGVVALCVVSNHMHLVVRVDGDRDARGISAFMKTLDQKIAQDLNRHRGRSGHFFQGKPHITPILDEAALAERMTYTHAQPVHHDLTERAEQWPGLSSFRAVCDGRPSLEVAYLDEDAWREAGARRTEIADFTQTVSVPITRPRAWERLSPRELRAARRAHEQSVRDRERDKLAERAAGGARRRLPKPERYTRIDPYSRPTGPFKRRPQPWAHGSAEAVRAFREAYSAMLEAYEVASARFRATGVLCAFPAGTFPPWIEEAFELT